MRWTLGSILTCTALLAAAGCATDDRQWMKLSEKYTTEDFRRDHAACSKTGKLDDSCMRGRGWVAVNPTGKSETAKDPYAREIGAPTGRPRGAAPGY
jgi:hypothetical protein